MIYSQDLLRKIFIEKKKEEAEPSVEASTLTALLTRAQRLLGSMRPTETTLFFRFFALWRRS